MENTKQSYIYIIGDRIATIANGLKQLINFKKSLLLLLIFIIINIPLTYIDFKVFNLGQPYIGKWEPVGEDLTIGLFLLSIILFTIVNYPDKMRLKLKFLIAFGIVATFLIACFLMITLHLESIFEVGVPIFFLLVLASLLIISNIDNEKRQKYKLAIALDIGFLWMFVYWIVIFILNWHILHNIFV